MEIDILIVGAGFAGLGMGIRLRQAGLDNFLILEQASGLGGTWNDNRYPGAACDVPSHLYSYSFENNPNWSRDFAGQAEILTYLERCADKYGVRPHMRFRRKVVGARFDEGRGTWSVQTEDGRTYTARVLVSSCGILNKPSYPQLPGLSTFQGPVFHTARWRSDAALDNKRVAVIGTGASAVQIVPELAKEVQALSVFQRTPGWVLPKPDKEIDVAVRSRFAKHAWLQKLARLMQYVRMEVLAPALLRTPKWLEMGRVAERMALRYLDEAVADPVLRAKLTPGYRIGCKRILLSNDYFAALQRKNTELVTSGIREVTPSGITTEDGTEHGYDAIVLATGFKSAEVHAPFPVRGRGGEELGERWKDGAEAYLGTTVSGFPNFFMLLGPNTALGHSSVVYMIESQIMYAVDAIRTLRGRDLKTLEVQKSVQDAFNQRLRGRLARTVWATGGCHSWYQTRTGKITTLWPGFTFEFRWRMRRFDAENYSLDPFPKREPARVESRGQVRPGVLS
ncbi:MAG TPA: NAD(P)/FAD-dependent oxidoreductase [Polyangiales bacterium]|nr:NAD(P)/FAD-dependent oxidoreductase [Polyangiales bacterium]